MKKFCAVAYAFAGITTALVAIVATVFAIAAFNVVYTPVLASASADAALSAAAATLAFGPLAYLAVAVAAIAGVAFFFITGLASHKFEVSQVRLAGYYLLGVIGLLGVAALLIVVS